VSSLSPSASFAPGSHRRSHPNLQHLSLAPLTPKYPIDPADYSAYFDPSTSELHTSASISQIASLPSPGGILSRSGTRSLAQSRASSRTRLNKKKNKSFVTIQAPMPLTEGSKGNIITTPHGAISSAGLGHTSISEKRLSGLDGHGLALHQTHSASFYTGGGSLHKSDSSWLIQTGLTLTEGSRESKGQSWISKRDSSTMLATPIDEHHSLSMTGLRSGRNTPGGGLSRRSSFTRKSRRSLAMTPRPLATPAAIDLETPDWADEQTKEELAAQYREDFGDEFSDDDEDPYGMLDFENQFDSDDEAELRKSIKGYRLGAWMDGLVDVFLQLEDDFPGSQVESGKDARTREREEEALKSAAHSTANGADTDGVASPSVRFDDAVEPPPERPKSVWDDVAWFGRMVARSVRS
jgi:hypothetical protein